MEETATINNKRLCVSNFTYKPLEKKKGDNSMSYTNVKTFWKENIIKNETVVLIITGALFAFLCIWGLLKTPTLSFLNMVLTILFLISYIKKS